jgi:hypothetical protein
MKLASDRSLRSLVEKWLGPTSQTPIRVTRAGSAQSSQVAYVHVELLLPRGPVGLFFFRHRDGSWCVFPPDGERPVMRVH